MMLTHHGILLTHKNIANEKFDFSAEELSELEALQVRGGATSNPRQPNGAK